MVTKAVITPHSRAHMPTFTAQLSTNEWLEFYPPWSNSTMTRKQFYSLHLQTVSPMVQSVHGKKHPIRTNHATQAWQIIFESIPSSLVVIGSIGTGFCPLEEQTTRASYGRHRESIDSDPNISGVLLIGFSRYSELPNNPRIVNRSKHTHVGQATAK